MTQEQAEVMLSQQSDMLVLLLLAAGFLFGIMLAGLLSFLRR
jgi:uncharacterized protein involved in exopolysaccharide biosynthesis